ncbi:MULTISPECIES: DUF3885 domain-containing protein [unclassified Moraxella]|uniref:DUF3885 domain-containing protein n=1 Tax=unclassified Moraxella TaxID=2685852 RepID=UPI003AF439D1
MTIKNTIFHTFGEQVFNRPLFYTYHGGLRFELSEGGTMLEQFLRALTKANEICQAIFHDNQSIMVCLRTLQQPNIFAYRTVLTELALAGIRIPKSHEYWIDRDMEDTELAWLTVAFEIPVNLLKNILWCALATDFGSIRPNPHCAVYLFDCDKQIMAFPYDDRGMDVVGKNHQRLTELYHKFNHYLLDYDRKTMQATFE